MAITQLLLAAKAALTDILITTDGVVTGLTVNKYGRLRVSTKPGVFASVSGNTVNVNDQVAVDVSEAATVIFGVKNTGSASLTAGTFVFEVSPDSTNGTDGTWYQVLASRSNLNQQDLNLVNPTIPSGTNLSNTWKASVNGYTWFRVRCTSAVTASSIAAWTVSRSSSATETNPSIPTHPVSQSGAPWTVSQSGTVTTQPATPSFYSLITTAAAQAANLKNAAGQLNELSVYNNSAAIIYLKLYNKASAPAPASDVPIHVIPIAAGAEFMRELSAIGKRFTTGISIGITGAAGNTDTTAIAAGIFVSATYS